MIRLCSRFDSVLFTPNIAEIPNYGNYSRSPSDIERGGGRYIYSGLRDVALEARDDIAAADQKLAGLDESASFVVIDRRTTTRLKSLSQLAEEFKRLIGSIRHDGQDNLLKAVLQPILKDPSFSDIAGGTIEELLGDNPETAFQSWSTGHKIVMQYWHPWWYMRAIVH
jgi:hypothetical protein